MVPLFRKVYSSSRNVGKDYFANEAFVPGNQASPCPAATISGNLIPASAGGRSDGVGIDRDVGNAGVGH
jgi:hypothetical protein